MCYSIQLFRETLVNHINKPQTLNRPLPRKISRAAHFLDGFGHEPTDKKKPEVDWLDNRSKSLPKEHNDYLSSAGTHANPSAMRPDFRNAPSAR